MTRYGLFRVEVRRAIRREILRDLLRGKLRDEGSEAGQALAELCIGLSLMVLLLLGAVDFGQVAYTSIEVSNAAKAGIQYGAQSGVTPQNATGMCAATDSPGIQNAVQNAAQDLAGITSSTSVACVCSDGSSCTFDPTVTTTQCPASFIEESLTVSTSYTHAPMIHWPLLPATFTVKGQATQKCGN